MPTYLRVGLFGSVTFKAAAPQGRAQQQLEQADEARKTLTRATQAFETKLPKRESGDVGENWPEWLIARILLLDGIKPDTACACLGGRASRRGQRLGR